jgi:CRP-like cAMP-binding protein
MIANLDPPEKLAELLPDSLHALCKHRSVPINEQLFRIGSSPKWMFYVIQGEVVLERVSHGGSVSCLQRCQMGFVGEGSLTSIRYHCNARATRPTELVQIPLREIKEALNSDPNFSDRWIQMLSAELRALRLQNERLSLQRVQDRIIHLLQTEGENGRYELSTSLKQVARELGVTHEALYRGIAALEESGKLIRDDDALRLTQ